MFLLISFIDLSNNKHNNAGLLTTTMLKIKKTSNNLKSDEKFVDVCLCFVQAIQLPVGGHTLVESPAETSLAHGGLTIQGFILTL